MPNVLVRAVVLVALLAPPHAAGLKYTTHSDFHQGSGAADPMSQMMATQLAAGFPQGGIDQTVILSEKGSRTEQKQAASGLPAGVVILMRADGSMLMMDPTAKTYWKPPSAADAAAQMQQMGIKMDAQTKKTGEFETISGMKAEKVLLNLSMTVPNVDPAMLPSFSVELWMTDTVKPPPAAAALIGGGMLAKLGLGDVSQLKDLNDGRFVVKQVMNLMGNQVVTTVNQVAKEEIADALFDVPKDFKEVAGPGGGLLPPPGR